jgi:hypothetical protein
MTRAETSAPDKTEIYLRQIKNMLSVLLLLACLAVAGGVIAGIAVAVAAHSGQPAATCQSQGGTDPGC